jgi:hypothetical protein
VSGKRRSLTGVWSGAYRYPGDAMPETVFNAVIEERGTAFTGRTEEPNWAKIGRAKIVTAEIEGVRSGTDVVFTKFMDGSGGMRHAIRYEGVVNEALTHIEGSWSIPRQWSGTFFMDREDVGESVAAERAEEVKAPR